MEVPERFDEALTQRWVGAIADALEQSDPETFAEFISDNPQLERSDLLGRPDWQERPSISNS